jgi:hypothetical protein
VKAGGRGASTRSKEPHAGAHKATGLRRQLFACLGREDLSSGETLVLLALRLYADNDGGNCYPSLATLAAQTHISKSRLISLLDALQSKGYLVIARSHGGRTHSNRYTLMIQRLNGSPEEPFPATNNGLDALPIPRANGSSSLLQTVQMGEKKGTDGEPELRSNSSNNPHGQEESGKRLAPAAFRDALASLKAAVRAQDGPREQSALTTALPLAPPAIAQQSAFRQVGEALPCHALPKPPGAVAVLSEESI